MQELFLTNLIVTEVLFMVLEATLFKQLFIMENCRHRQVKRVLFWNFTYAAVGLKFIHRLLLIFASLVSSVILPASPMHTPASGNSEAHLETPWHFIFQWFNWVLSLCIIFNQKDGTWDRGSVGLWYGISWKTRNRAWAHWSREEKTQAGTFGVHKQKEQ